MPSPPHSPTAWHLPPLPGSRGPCWLSHSCTLGGESPPAISHALRTRTELITVAPPTSSASSPPITHLSTHTSCVPPLGGKLCPVAPGRMLSPTVSPPTPMGCSPVAPSPGDPPMGLQSPPLLSSTAPATEQFPFELHWLWLNTVSPGSHTGPGTQQVLNKYGSTRIGQPMHLLSTQRHETPSHGACHDPIL